MRFITILFTFTVFIGCSAQKKVNTKEDRNACKTVRDTSLDQQKAIHKTSVTMTRGSVKVKYKDCDQNEFLKQKQQVKDTAAVALDVKANFKLTESQMSVSVYNRTNCESGNFRTRAKSSLLEIPVSVEKSNQHLKLATDRENYIDYEIRECETVNSEFHCTKSEVVEKGTLVLAVQFADYELGDEKEITVCRVPEQKRGPNRPTKN